jgi:hypothetical protein
MENKKSYKVIYIEDDREKCPLDDFKSNIIDDSSRIVDALRKILKDYTDIKQTGAEFDTFPPLFDKDFSHWVPKPVDSRGLFKSLHPNPFERFIVSPDFFIGYKDNACFNNSRLSVKKEENTQLPLHIQQITFSATGKITTPFLPGCEAFQLPVFSDDVNSHQRPGRHIYCPIYKKNYIYRSSSFAQSLEKSLITQVGGNSFFYDVIEKEKDRETSRFSHYIDHFIISCGLFFSPVDSTLSPAAKASLTDILHTLQKLVVKTAKKIKSFRRKISQFFWRDLRTSYRKIIRFLFKNLSDTSGSDDNFVYQPGKHFINQLKEILYETKNRFNQGVEPCYQFQNE